MSTSTDPTEPAEPMELDAQDTVETKIVKNYENNEDEDEELLRGLDKFGKPSEEQDTSTEAMRREQPQQEQAHCEVIQQHQVLQDIRQNQVDQQHQVLQNIRQNQQHQVLQQNQANQESYPNYSAHVNNLETKIKDLENRVRDHEMVINAITKENDKLTSTSELINHVNSLKTKVHEYETLVKAITDANDKLNSPNKLIEHVNKVTECENLIDEMAKAYEAEKEKTLSLKGALKEREKQLDHYFNKNNSLQGENEYLRNQIGQYKKACDNMHRDLENIKKVNEDLRGEAADYQSRLGDAKNYRLGDDDRNNSTRLTQDIEELQNKINTYARVKKGVVLNMDKAKFGLLEFGCNMESSTNPDQAEDNKMLIKALLQRVVLKTIMEETNKYLRVTNFDREYLRELEIVVKSKELINNVRDFAVRRVGEDEVSHVAPTKIRQQIFALLGDRGFSDVQGKNGAIKHPFVAEVARILDQTVNEYRTFKDEDRRKEYDELASDIIREVIKIFYFRCKVQEPVAELKWIEKGEKIDSTVMQGFWDEQIDQWSVDLCYFPLIGINLKNEKHRKVLYPAKVLAIKEKAETGMLSKATSFVTKGVSKGMIAAKAFINPLPDDDRNVGSNCGGYTGESFRSDNMDDMHAVASHQSHNTYTEGDRQSEHNRKVKTDNQFGNRSGRNNQNHNTYTQCGNNNNDQYGSGHTDANYNRNIGAKQGRKSDRSSHERGNQDPLRTANSENSHSHPGTHPETHPETHLSSVRHNDVKKTPDTINRDPPNVVNLENPSNPTEARMKMFSTINPSPLHDVNPENPSKYTLVTNTPERSHSLPASSDSSKPGNDDPRRSSMDGIRSSPTGDGDQSRRSSGNSYVDLGTNSNSGGSD